jgi:hypothetical protein
VENDDDIKGIPINQVCQEAGAHELATSPDMKPYLRLIMSQLQGADSTRELEAIRQLPLERRYVWRVASALKWALADCEDWNVEADKRTLTPEDLAKVNELLESRPAQFCAFLRAMVGAEKMERRMLQAIGAANQK